MEVVRPPPGSPAPAEQAEVPASDAAAQRQQRIDAFFQSAPQDLMNVIDAIVESEQATQEEARAAAYDFLTNIDVTPSGEPTPDIQIRRRSGIAVARVLTAEDFQAIDGFDDTHATPEFVARINQLLIDRESSDRTGTRAGTDLASALRGTGIDTRALDGYIRAHPELRLRIGDLSGENAQDTLMRNIIGRVSSARTSDGEAPEAAR
jgi:hypothetical protein